MRNNPPDLSKELRLGRRALEHIEELQLLDGDFEWHGIAERWSLKCRLTIQVPPESLVPGSTDWFLLVYPDYPAGTIGLWPAKLGGLTITFPHQALNREGSADFPWREGKLCLDNDLGVLRRQGLDHEPRTAGARLVWHIQRALEWLTLASQNKLLQRGHYFELPSYPAESRQLLVFSEPAANLESWLRSPARSGYVELAKVQAAARPLLVVRSFETVELAAPQWGSFLAVQGKPAPLGAWILVDHPIALRPWQAPTTWGELRSQLHEQGVDLEALLDRLSPRLREHDPPREKRPGHVLLLGFPIPEKVCGPPVRVHWLALELLPLSAGVDFADGFRKREDGYRRRDARLLRESKPLNWIESECWEKDELSGRGRLGRSLRGTKVALLGAGALGSPLAELLVRGGVDDLTVLDPDRLEAGNLVRHSLGLADVGDRKAYALARRLDQLAPSASITGVAQGFPTHLFNPDQAELIVDATGEDDVLLRLQGHSWSRDHWFASLWVGMHAHRIYCFSFHGRSFPLDTCLELYEEWREREHREYSEEEEPPRPGIGCWLPVFPSRADDMGLAAAILVKHLDRVLARNEPGPLLAVYEQSPDPDSPGIRRLQ